MQPPWMNAALSAQSRHPAHCTCAAIAARIPAVRGVREICGKSHSHRTDLAAGAPKMIYEFLVWLGISR